MVPNQMKFTVLTNTTPNRYIHTKCMAILVVPWVTTFYKKTFWSIQVRLCMYMFSTVQNPIYS